jgi:uncharacterized protein YcbX
MHLAAIWVYPVKGARGTSVRSAVVGERGFIDDRRYMVVDVDGVALTQRENAGLALVVPRVEEDGLTIDAPGMPTLMVGRAGPPRTVSVWSSRVEAVEVEGAGWFSRYLGERCALVYMPESSRRPVKPKHDATGAIVSFADGFPFLLANEASLADLNRRLAEPVPMDRFRPNVVVAGAEAWAEDGWDEITIGSIPFSVPKPCDRCVVTTIDQATGVGGKEPLRTLATFRARDGAVWFGENLVHHAQGALAVGDAVAAMRVG